MPFQSDKQRRWMYANEPGIAREWSDRYGAAGGGISRLPLAFTTGESVGTQYDYGDNDRMAYVPGSDEDKFLKTLYEMKNTYGDTPAYQQNLQQDWDNFKETGDPLSLPKQEYSGVKGFASLNDPYASIAGQTAMIPEGMLGTMTDAYSGSMEGIPSAYLGMNSPLNFPGEEFGETTPSWSTDTISPSYLTDQGEFAGTYDPAFGQLEDWTKGTTTYPAKDPYSMSYYNYGEQVPRMSELRNITSGDFYENFRDQGTDDTEEVREQIRTGEIPQNFKTRMNNPFFERPTFSNSPTLANYFNEGLGGMEGVKEKMGQGWDFAKQIPRMAMGALSGITGAGLLMGALKESPEQKAMMGLYNTSEYQKNLQAIPGMSNYNPVYGMGAGYGLSGAIDKRMARIRKTLQNKKSSVLEQRLRNLQDLKDKEKAHFAKPNTGVGAQGGGGGTNIGGGQGGAPTKAASTASYDRPGAKGSPGYRW